jgi:hypothetical protein
MEIDHYFLPRLDGISTFHTFTCTVIFLKNNTTVIMAFHFLVS